MITAIKDPLVDLTALNDCVDEEPVVNNSNAKMNNLANQNMIRRYEVTRIVNNVLVLHDLIVCTLLQLQSTFHTSVESL